MIDGELVVMARDPAIRAGIARFVARLGFGVRDAAPDEEATFRAPGIAGALLILDDGKAGLEPSAITLARKLRTDADSRFLAPVLLLAFGVREVERWSRDLGDAGVRVVRLPCTLREVAQVLRETRPLTPLAWDRVSRRLRRQRVASGASALRHRLDGRWAATLSALLEIEKLAHFRAPDGTRLAKHRETVHGAVCAQALDPVARDVAFLLDEASRAGLCTRDATSRVLASLTAVSDATNALRDRSGRALAAAAREAWDALHAVLEEVSAVQRAVDMGNDRDE